MNSPVVRRASEALAARPGASPEQAVRRGYALALGRPATTTELADSLAFLREQKQAYQADGRANAEGLARLDFAQVLLGLNEFVYVD